MPSVSARPAVAVVAVLAVVLAGCTGGGPAGTTTPPDDTTESTVPTTTDATTAEATTTDTRTTTADYTAMGDDGYYRGYDFRARETRLAELADSVAPAPEELEPEREPLVRRGARNGSVTAKHTGGERSGPLASLDYLRANGTYYAVNATTVGRERRTAYQFDLEGPVGSPTSEYDLDRAKREAVAAENLSAPDRRVFFEGLPPAEDRLDRDEGSFLAGFYYFYPNDTVPAAATVADGETHFVGYDGNYYALTFDGTRRLDRYETRYDFVPVADDRSEFASLVRDRYVTNLSTADLDDGNRSRLADLVRGGHVEWSGNASAVPERIRRLERLVDRLPPESNVAYVERDGTYYRLTLRLVME